MLNSWKFETIAQICINKKQKNMETKMTVADLQKRCSVCLAIHKERAFLKLAYIVKKYLNHNDITEISAAKLSELSGLDKKMSFDILIKLNKEYFARKSK